MKRICIVLVCIAVFLSNLNLVYAQDGTVYYHSTISGCLDDSYAVTNDGVLWGWLFGGAIGIGVDSKIKPPTKIMNQVVSVSSGYGNTYAIRTDGSLWGWGSNEKGQLGNGTLDPQWMPVKIMEDVVLVRNGESFMLAIKEDGSLWGCGSNEEGELGLEGADWYTTPQCIMKDVKEVAAGKSHSLVLKEDGSVWTFGYNGVGQLGDGTYDNRTVPKEIMQHVKRIDTREHGSFAVDQEDCLWFWGRNFFSMQKGDQIMPTHPNPVRYVEDVLCVSEQHEFNTVLKTDGSIWAYWDPALEEPKQMGDNVLEFPYKISGDGEEFSDIHGLFILNKDGELFWGGASRKNPEGGKNVFTYTKVLNNVRQPGANTIVDKQYQDTAALPEEHQKAIKALSRAGIISGTSETEFSPAKEVTRAEAAALLLRMTAKPEEQDNGGFLDVPAGAWYYGVAGASKKYGIISGYEDNTFRADMVLSKVQLVSLAARVLKAEKPELEMPDGIMLQYQDTVPEWAKEDVALACGMGLVENQGNFNADAPITRADAAVLLYKLYNLI